LTSGIHPANIRRVDPLTLIVTAVALGASAGLKDTAAQIVKDAYAGLKALLGRRSVDVSGVERKPDSGSKQASLREDLQELQDADPVDDELVEAAKRVVAAVRAHDPDAGAAIGIDLDEFEAKSLRISGVTSKNTGVRGQKWTIEGDAVFENIQAGGGGSMAEPAPTEDTDRPR
jgi:hypothetical protein